jgi:type VI secretion system secreted protein Hcp
MAFDAFLKIEGVDGESLDDKHKDWIEIESFSWGASQLGAHASGGGGGAGRVSFQDFSMVHRIDKSSPILFLRCASGEHIKKAVLVLYRQSGSQGPGQSPYMVYTMSDVLVSSVKPSGDDQEIASASAPAHALPMENFSLNFTKVEMEYNLVDRTGGAGGSVRAGWDLATNKKV